MTDLRSDWQKRQAARCSCKGHDEYCPCQNTDFSAPKPTPPERERALEEAARIMDARAAMYRTKAERHHPLAPDSLTEHERFISNAEASEHGAAAIRALSASPTEVVEK